MSRTDDRRITVIVPKDIHRSLKMEAVRQETTVSDIVRGLITEWLTRLNGDTPRVENTRENRHPA